MGKKSGLILIVFVVALFVGSDAMAQRGTRWSGSGGWGPTGQYGRLYDQKTVETITGRVTGVERIAPMKGMSSGIHLLVKIEKETVVVHLGPSWYITNQDVKILPGDQVRVTGSKITLDGKPVLIAAEVQKGDEVLRLRDENGFPAWSGWRRR